MVIATDRKESENSDVATLSVYHARGREVRSLEEGVEIIIGRELPAMLRIDDRSLSRLHARFVNARGVITVEDLGSTNGTFVRGERVRKAILVDGAEVKMGDVVVILRDPASSPFVIDRIDALDPFLDRVGEELARCRMFGRIATLLFVVGQGGDSIRDLRSRLVPLLRPIDRTAAYAHNACLVLLPETDAKTAMTLVRNMRGLGLRVQAASASGGSVAELVTRTIEGGSTTKEIDGIVIIGGEDRATPEQQQQQQQQQQPQQQERNTSVVEAAPVVASGRMSAILAELDRVSASKLTILLRGETGVGKDVFARRIHERSGRRGPLRAINCGAIAPTLLASLLFGHERGAFTGAERAQAGLFEQASGGTVFLDEVGELSAEAQSALLRVLETHCVQRLGSSRDVNVDVRVIAATNKDLLAMSASGTFQRTSSTDSRDLASSSHLCERGVRTSLR